MSLRTAIAYQVFDRPDLTRRSFAAIAAARPSRLFVFADGPRTEADRIQVEATRAIVRQVDWDCEVHQHFSDTNLGCRRRLVSGLDWVFSHVDEAIVLEDDSLPDPSFFPFCEALLDHYRDDPEVVMVCSTNYLQEWRPEERDYHFSHIGSPWGFGTWKRAWALYEDDITPWGRPEVRARIQALLDDEDVFAFEAGRFDWLLADPEDRHCWDLIWMFTHLAHGAKCVVPARNLLENLGNAGPGGLPPDHPVARLTASSAPLPVRFHDDPVDREYDHLHVDRQSAYWIERARRAVPSPPGPLRRITPPWAKRLVRRVGSRLRGGSA